MDDLHGLEKTGRLPRALTTDGVPPGSDPEPNEIGYYAPGHDLVLYYGDVGYYNGIIRIGRFDDSIDAIADQPDGVTSPSSGTDPLATNGSASASNQRRSSPDRASAHQLRAPMSRLLDLVAATGGMVTDEAVSFAIMDNPVDSGPTFSSYLAAPKWLIAKDIASVDIGVA